MAEAAPQRESERQTLLSEQEQQVSQAKNTTTLLAANTSVPIQEARVPQSDMQLPQPSARLPPSLTSVSAPLCDDSAAIVETEVRQREFSLTPTATSSMSHKTGASEDLGSSSLSETASAPVTSPIAEAFKPLLLPNTSPKEGYRPALPTERNPLIPTTPSPVKLQSIRRSTLNTEGERESKDVVIGRIKMPSPTGSGHSFLLKRFDTGGIAANYMFKLAFPQASREEEEHEMKWLAQVYPACVRANGGKLQHVDPTTQEIHTVLPPGSTGVSLGGLWLTEQDAQEVAEEYGLSLHIRELAQSRATLLGDQTYFADSLGRPIAYSSGHPVPRREKDRLWAYFAPVLLDEMRDEPPRRAVHEETKPPEKKSRLDEPGAKQDDQDQEHVLVAEHEEALRASRETAHLTQNPNSASNSESIQSSASNSDSIQSCASNSDSIRSKSQAKRRAEPDPVSVGAGQREDGSRFPVLTRAQQGYERAKNFALTRATSSIQSRSRLTGTSSTTRTPDETEDGNTEPRPIRRLASTARARAWLQTHPLASTAGVAGVGVAAAVASSGWGMDWAATMQAVQTGLLNLHHWFA